MENYQFGVKPKHGRVKPSSDYHFEFDLKVVASHPASTGFVVFPQRNVDMDNAEPITTSGHV